MDSQALAHMCMYSFLWDWKSDFEQIFVLYKNIVHNLYMLQLNTAISCVCVITQNQGAH